MEFFILPTNRCRVWPNSRQVPPENRPVESLYNSTYPGGSRSPEAGYMRLSVANAAASASAQGDNATTTEIELETVPISYVMSLGARCLVLPCITVQVLGFV
jgi:hypothetical protein